MYFNPVKIIETNKWQEECIRCQKDLGIQNPVIVTSKGNSNRLNLTAVFNHDSIFSAVKPNPTFDSCQEGLDFCHNKQFDGVVAIGGGSVMDTAKVIMAALGTDLHTVEELLVVDYPFPHQVPSIFIPTTHGTASEVTMWGTIWDMKEKKKHSISHTDLYPKVAILDGYLTLSLPLDISLITMLDALSHSFEAIWNKNANPQSTEYAIKAICLILENVEKLKDDLNNIETRKQLLKASNIAGLAFSNTKTGATHSISYPLTMLYNIPHGIAASMSIVPLLKINKQAIENNLIRIITELGYRDIGELISEIQEIPKDCVKFSLQEWGVRLDGLEGLARHVISIEKTQNNVVKLDKKMIRLILEEMY